MSDRLFLFCVAAIFGTSLATGTFARADYLSQTVILDQSNTLKSGVAYGSVLVEGFDGVGIGGGGLKAGEVRLTYTANGAPYTSLGATFGIQSVGFNTDLSLTSPQITGPAGWTNTSSTTISSFGKFAWGVDGTAKGGFRPNPATVLITGLGADATPAHFLFGSTSNDKSASTDSSVFFAMHVAGFTLAGVGVDSHFVGGSTIGQGPPPPGGSGGGDPPPPGGTGDVQPTPEPSTFILGGTCLACLSLVRLSSRMKKKGNG